MTLSLDIAALDRTDLLATVRDRFLIPPNLIYLDGNSLGVLPKHVPERLERAVRIEWGMDLIRSWNKNDWIDLPVRVGAQIAKLVGAHADEVIAADSTSINVFKVMLAALKLHPDRHVIVSVIDNFPTDLYIVQGINDLFSGRYELRFVRRDQLEASIDDAVAVVLLTEVDYRTGELYDMARVTKLTHDHGAIAVWDLAHSAGAFPVDLEGCQVDFAVGCGYKYLNGGPGAPAFLYVARRHQANAAAFLAGWMGHSAPFAFTAEYTPSADLRRMTVGTPSVLGMIALEASLEVFDHVSMRNVRAKSVALTDLFIDLMRPLCLEFGFVLVSPADAARRGSQVSYAHEHGYEIMQALIASDVIGDFRAPNIVRFGFTPLYLRFEDVLNAVARLEAIMRDARWRNPEFQARSKVT